MTEDREPWHLDKKVPIAMIFAILMQTVGAVWWAATINAAVTRQQEQIEAQGAEIDRLEGNATQQEVARARITQELQDVQKSLDRLEQGQSQMNDYLRELLTDTP
jgi:septation ring formation regulator EzrA